MGKGQSQLYWTQGSFQEKNYKKLNSNKKNSVIQLGTKTKFRSSLERKTRTETKSKWSDMGRQHTQTHIPSTIIVFYI